MTLSGEQGYITGAGKTRKEVPVPDDLQDELSLMRDSLMEAAAGTDEALMEKFFDEGALSRRGNRARSARGRSGRHRRARCSAAPAATRVGVMAKLARQLHRPAAVPGGSRSMTGVNPKTGDEPTTRVCAEAQPFSAQVFKTVADPFVGQLSMSEGAVRRTHQADASAVQRQRGKGRKARHHLRPARQEADRRNRSLHAGDLGALAKLQYTSTGDTLCDCNKPIQYPTLDYPAPCISQGGLRQEGRASEDKVFSGLARLMEEDPTIKLEKNVETTETLLSGHGRNASGRDPQQAGGQVRRRVPCCRIPKIPYRETIRKAVEGAGPPQEAVRRSRPVRRCMDRVLALSATADSDFEFEDAVVGGVVPRNFIPSVEKGLRENMPHGRAGRLSHGRPAREAVRWLLPPG